MSTNEYYGNEKAANTGQQGQGGYYSYPQQTSVQQDNMYQQSTNNMPMSYPNSDNVAQPPFDQPNEKWQNDNYPNQAPPQYQSYPPEPQTNANNQQPPYGSEYRQGADLPSGAPMQSGTTGPEDERGVMGALAGGAAGAYGGHQLGHGVIGTLLGAYAGSKLEDHFKDKKGNEHQHQDSKPLSSHSSGSDDNRKHGFWARREEMMERRQDMMDQRREEMMERREEMMEQKREWMDRRHHSHR